MGGARLVGLLLIFFGAALAAELGVRGRTLTQAWSDLRAFLHVPGLVPSPSAGSSSAGGTFGPVAPQAGGATPGTLLGP